MTEFENRVSTNTNRRILDVIKINSEPDGSIQSMVVDVSRGDSEVLTVGTALDASSLSEAVLSTVYSHLYGISIPSGNLEVYWTQSRGSLKSKTFRINLSGSIFYAKLSNNGYITGTATTSSQMDVTIQETTYLNNLTGTKRDLEFYVEFYWDSNRTQFVTRIKGIIHYTPESGTPAD